MTNTYNNQGGFIKMIILIIILIAILSYFGFNLRGFIESPIVQDNFRYVWDKVVYVWDTFLAMPAKYLWNDVFIDLIWKPFIEALKKIKGGSGNPLWKGDQTTYKDLQASPALL